MLLFLTRIEPFLAETLFEKACGLLEEKRLARVRACKDREEQARSLCAGLLLHYAPDWTAGRPLSYKIGENGKPYNGEPGGLHFSLSHSGAYAALALSENPVGLDIQQLRPVKEPIVGRVLTAREKEWLDGQPGAAAAGTAIHRQWRFIRLWAVKESFLKLTGQGLAGDMRQVDCFPEEGRLCYTSPSGEMLCARFREYRLAGPDGDYAVSLCGCQTAHGAVDEKARAEHFPDGPRDITDWLLAHMVS